jgi:hypothetical protein
MSRKAEADLKELADFMTSETPLWRQFYEMSEEEVKAQQAHDIARLESGEMTKTEALERAAAWRQAGEQQIKEGEALQTLAASMSDDPSLHP